MYKFEIHLHTNACSACGVSSAEEMIDAAIENGYSGVVFTNHFYHGNTCIDRNLPWEEFVGAYEQDYLRAKKYGEEKGIKVFFGVEEGYDAGKEMLIYGLSPDTLKNCPEFIMMGAKEKADFVHKNGGITVCAHPFRKANYIPNPDKEPPTEIFDGIECFNYLNSCRDNEWNKKAFSFAEKTGLIKTSGGDVHNKSGFGNAGIDFDLPINTYEDFIENLKNGKYKLIIKED